jgi:hypothetical protein
VERRSKGDELRQLTIIGGAGINIGISHACPSADEMLNFTYQKISASVFQRIAPEIRELFAPESFDYILGGLLTVNLAIERTKQDLKRFKINEEAFTRLFRQSDLQLSIASSLDQIEQQLTVSIDQMMSVVKEFSPAVDEVVAHYDSINYFTVNFDGIFDHILYGPQYTRSNIVTDYWRGSGAFNPNATAKIKILHLHGDLRYKPSKRTSYHQPPYRWPVLVVGDPEIKRGLIASHESLSFYLKRLRHLTKDRGSAAKNVLAIIGFGFRDEDAHIVNCIKHALGAGVFDDVLVFDVQDRLSGLLPHYTWVTPNQENLIAFMRRLGSCSA